MNPFQVLRKYFGYDGFRTHQEEIVNHLIGGGDAFVLMPTGSGKSLCYQVPAIILPGVCVVVSPLIALMQDQVDAVRELGIRAGFLNSTLNIDEAQKIEAQVVSGELGSSLCRARTTRNGRFYAVAHQIKDMPLRHRRSPLCIPVGT